MYVSPLADSCLCLVSDGVESGLGLEVEVGERFLDISDRRRIGWFSLSIARERQMARQALERGRASVRLCVRG